MLKKVLFNTFLSSLCLNKQSFRMNVYYKLMEKPVLVSIKKPLTKVRIKNLLRQTYTRYSGVADEEQKMVLGDISVILKLLLDIVWGCRL